MLLLCGFLARDSNGNKLFNSASGEEFCIRGIAYAPCPNAGELAGVSNVDCFDNLHEHVWAPHIEVMKDLGVNTIRLYSVSPILSHDKFMCACSEAGIYVLMGLAASCANCAIMKVQPPSCYPDSLFARAQIIYNAFAVYDIAFGFSVASELNFLIKYNEQGTTTTPCAKAFLRVTRTAASMLRDQSPSVLTLPTSFRVMNSPTTTIALWGMTKARELDDADFAHAAYARPVMFGEFGCNLGANAIDGWEN
uniref:1,3-beta-glucanosyltransferase n=1 Tax=Globisporangium ultimum (strain ATCC 200006 / CBS 805.95 / DAOM BR144) TaxID=431595 RepID=K3WW78_GLOUD